MNAAASPVVSIIIPVFNRETTISRAIRSVKDQTYQQWECIIVDDCSTDRSMEIAAEYMEHDSRIQLFRLPRNSGANIARNFGIARSRGSYIALLDADDVWMPRKLAEVMEIFVSASPSTGMVYSGIEYIYPEKNVPHAPYAGKNLVDRLLINNVIGGCSVAVIKKTVFEESGTFDEALKARQDLDMWIRIAGKYSIKASSNNLVRIHNDTDNRISFNRKNSIDARWGFYRKYSSMLRERKLLVKHLKRCAKDIRRIGGDFTECIPFLQEAVRQQPWNPAAWYNLIKYALRWKFRS